MEKFEIPVTVFFFRRPDTTVQVINQIAKVRPKKLYLICDGGRDSKEHEIVVECRKIVEQAINWECEIIKNYAEKNRGVFENIGMGAKWVLSKEKEAIFLEDDNLPEVSFFRFCKEMLEKYRNEQKILWICGTNYLERYNPENKASYVFTKHLMPCGWASWSEKFNDLYDGELKQARAPETARKLKTKYKNKALYRQQRYNVQSTLNKLEINPQKASWDHQMAFSIRINDVYGIAPKVNLIKNIGVDERSTHGGTSYRKVMTRRFCGIESYELNFPLNHPTEILEDEIYEKRVGKIILLPLANRALIKVVRTIKPILGISKYESINEGLKRKKKKTINK